MPTEPEKFVDEILPHGGSLDAQSPQDRRVPWFAMTASESKWHYENERSPEDTHPRGQNGDSDSAFSQSASMHAERRGNETEVESDAAPFDKLDVERRGNETEAEIYVAPFDKKQQYLGTSLMMTTDGEVGIMKPSANKAIGTAGMNRYTVLDALTTPGGHDLRKEPPQLSHSPTSGSEDSGRLVLVEKQLLFLNRMVRSFEKEIAHLKKSQEGKSLISNDEFETSVETFKDEEDDQANSDENMEQEDEEEAEDEDKTHEANLAEDTFSFLVSAHTCSVPFVLGAFVFLLKNAIFALVMVNLINFDTRFNRLGVPVSVDSAVVISQFLAFLISVLTQNDLITSLVTFYHGYSKSMVEVYGRDGRGGGTRFQWMLAIFCSFLDGLFGLVATFMLIVTSATVLDVLLNFAAVEFVSGLDEAAFALAQLGFLGVGNRAEAKIVAESTYTVKDAKKVHRSHVLHSLGLMSVLVSVVCLWIFIFSLQQQGRFNAKYLIVQFGDLIRPSLGAHSGIYHLKTNPRASASNRFRYRETRGSGEFGFCRSQREWTYYTTGMDPCNYTNVIAKSVLTHSFDLRDVAGDIWFVRRKDSDHFLPMQDFHMDVGCEMVDDCGGNGRCIKNKCECDPDFFGMRCEYNKANRCAKVQLDERFDTQFPSVRQVANEYSLLQLKKNHSEIYHHPIYYNEKFNDVLVYTGVRWAIANLRDGFGLSSPEELEIIDQDASFYAGSIKFIDLMSDPIVYQTPDDRRSTPTIVNWNIVPNPTELSNIRVVAPALPVRLICGVCDNLTNFCNFNNVCNAGKCECANGEGGALCQVTPTNDGKCDPNFNNPSFLYDGGDCCQKTCTSTATTKCGVTSVGNINTINLGFPYCADPALVGQRLTNTSQLVEEKFVPISDPIIGLAELLVYPTLSANGLVLALGEPSVGIVRIFDLVGSQWVQRGRDLRGQIASLKSNGFGHRIALATPPADVIEGAFGAKLPVYIAVADETGQVRFFEWGDNSDWIEGPSVPAISLPTCCLGEPATALKGNYRLELSFDFLATRNSTVTLLVDNGPDHKPYLPGYVPGAESVHVFQHYPGGTSWSAFNYTNTRRAGLSEDGNLIALNPRAGIISMFALPNGAPRSLRNFTVRVMIPTPNIPDGNRLRVVAIRPRTSRFTQGSYRSIGLMAVSTVYSQGRELVAVGYYELNRETNPPHLVERSVVVNSYYSEMNLNLTHAIVANDGNAVVLVYADGNVDHYRTLRLDEQYHWEELAETNSTFQNRVQYAVPVALADGGLTIAQGREGAANVEQVGYPRCGVNESSFRISIKTNQKPADISWSLFQVADFHGFYSATKVHASCDSCYNSPLYSWSVVSRDVCVRDSEIPCLALNFTASFSLQTDGFAAYLIEPPRSVQQQFSTVTPFASAEGRDASKEVIYRRPGSLCTLPTRVCTSVGEEPLLVAHDVHWLDDLRVEVFLRNMNNVFHSEKIISDLTGRHVSEIGCFTSECRRIDLSYRPDHGSIGLKFENRTRSYGIFRGTQELSRGELEFDVTTEVFIGNC